MKRVLLGLLFLVVALIAVRQVVFLLASDETKIAWLIEGMEEGFNDAHAGRAVEGLANDWGHAGSPIDRSSLQAALFQEFRSFGQSKKGRETYRVTVIEDSLEITVDGDRASIACEAEFARQHEEEWSPVWRIRIDAKLEDGEDGWRFTSSSHEDLVGWGLR